jgi:hypothetical protein
MELVGDGLAERGARVLADLDLAGEDGHGSVLGDVQPRGEVVVGRLAPAAPRLLALQVAGRDQDDDASEKVQEVAAAELETIGESRVKLVALGLELEVGGRLPLAHVWLPVREPPPGAGRVVLAAAWRIARTMRG